MADTTTPNIGLTNQEEGGNNNTWGAIADANFERIDDVLGDLTIASVTGGDYTLTSSEEYVLTIRASGTLVSNSNIIFSGRKGFWIIDNNTAGDFTLTCKVSGQSGVAIDQGATQVVYCDGTDIALAVVIQGETVVPEETIASATTTNVLGSSSEFVAISGTATITSLGSGANTRRFCRATGAFTLTHNATSLILPTGANITVAAGDTFIVISDASSNARILAFQRASGEALTLTIADKAVTNAKLADMAAYTIKLRNNVADGVPGDVKISSLTEETAPATGDFLLGEESGGALRKFDIGNISVSPRGYIDGYIVSNNASDANNDIDISAGQARSSDNTIDIPLNSTLTKRLDATFTAGTNQGMLDTGTKQADTWYHIHSILNPTSGAVDVLASTSLASPTMPSGYTKLRRIASILTDSSGNIIAFKQYPGGEFQWDNPPLDVNNVTFTTSAQTAVLSTPPDIQVLAYVNLGAGDALVYISSIDIDDEAPSETVAPLSSSGNSTGGTNSNNTEQARVWTDTSSQIRYRGSNASRSLYLATLGWWDPRGKDS